MTPREKLARVIEPEWFDTLDRVKSGRKSIYGSNIGVATASTAERRVNEALDAADRILARWPEIEKIVERE